MNHDRPVILDELFAFLSTVERIVVRESPLKDTKVLFESSAREDILDLQNALDLRVSSEDFHCMCAGEPALELIGPGDSRVLLTNHHGVSVRCSLWTSDVLLGNTEAWLSWFDKRSIPGPRNEVEVAKLQREQLRRDNDKWLAAMPKAIAPLWEGAIGNFGSVDVSPFRAVLEADISDRTSRIRALLEWYGSGAGPWSGFPSYEEAAEKLLLDFATGALVEAIQASPLTHAQTEGAARLFGGWSFNKLRPRDRNAIPEALKTMLWNHVKDTTDADKRARAVYAFGVSV